MMEKADCTLTQWHELWKGQRDQQSHINSFRSQVRDAAGTAQSGHQILTDSAAGEKELAVTIIADREEH